ncbi:MAG: rRNA maturation RNase YbeY [Casimicrobiaceae bacterium]
MTARRRLTLTVQHATADADLPARGLLRRCVVAALERDANITLRFVERDEARRLNRRYRHQDHPTNVLSFVYDDERDVLHGDIVLCAPVLRREAEQQGKALAAHCAHLVVHGALHLQGYDHADAAEAQRMEARETAILARLGYADPYAADRRPSRGAR